MDIFNIAIDGPSGSGKTTIAKALSERLGIAYLDTGAMYRSVAYYIAGLNISASDEQGVKSVLDNIELKVEYSQGVNRLFVNGEEVTDKIRTPEISMSASTVSKIKEVRLKLVALQREIARKVSCVLDGRDIGSFVLPEADYKFYLTADVDERAKRRFLELKAKGENVTIDGVKEAMIARDAQDEKRAFAPLVVPQGAFVVDTTNLTIEEVIDILLSKIKIR